MAKYMLEHQEYEEGEAEYDAADYPFLIVGTDEDGDKYIEAMCASEEVADKIMAALNAS